MTSRRPRARSPTTEAARVARPRGDGGGARPRLSHRGWVAPFGRNGRCRARQTAPAGTGVHGANEEVELGRTPYARPSDPRAARLPARRVARRAGPCVDGGPLASVRVRRRWSRIWSITARAVDRNVDRSRRPAVDRWGLLREVAAVGRSLEGRERDVRSGSLRGGEVLCDGSVSRGGQFSLAVAQSDCARARAQQHCASSTRWPPDSRRPVPTGNRVGGRERSNNQGRRQCGLRTVGRWRC